jgi:hypothetical protein
MAASSTQGNNQLYESMREREDIVADSDAPDRTRQLSVSERFLLRRRLHADLERRARLKGSTLLSLPKVRKSRAAANRPYNPAAERADAESPTLHDSAAAHTASNSLPGDCPSFRDSENGTVPFIGYGTPSTRTSVRIPPRA